MKNTVQNNPATVANIELVEGCVNETAGDVTQNVFEQVIKLGYIKHIAKDIVANVSADLQEASFFTENLELSDKQREKMLDSLEGAVMKARDVYIGNIKKDERTKNIANIVQTNLVKLCEEVLAGIGAEVNRGALISATAVGADTKNQNHNKIELNYPKHAGDITIPTRGVFISTNCVQVIKDSIEVDLSEPEENEKPTEGEESTDETEQQKSSMEQFVDSQEGDE